jgi:prepilin-type N-terminal cleavage/methylation domain-containing protein
MSFSGQREEVSRQNFCHGAAVQLSGWRHTGEYSHRSSIRGFTLIELVVVVTIIAILYTVFLNRIWFYQERAEKTAMVEMAGALQSALVMQYGRLMVRGREADVVALQTDNPMQWLAKKPRNYAGEFYDPQPGSVEPGSWVFDLKTRELVYILNRSDYFISGADGQKWVRYRVNLMYDPVRGTRNKAAKELVGTLFEPVEPYRWFD